MRLTSPLLKNPFILAPMAGITTMPFRRLMARMGAGCVISEFVSAHAVTRKSPRLKQYIEFHQDEHPVGIQLFGGETEVLVNAAKILEDTGIDFVDINLGCPVPKVTKKGGGSAWLCHPLDLADMLKKVRASLKIPLTIKIRLGWDESSKNAKEIVHIAEEEGIHWVAIHGRTRMQGYSGLSDWEAIAAIASDSKIPIIGNGDVVSGPLAAARLLDSGCAGIMIGRGALKNPWIFMEAEESRKEAESIDEEQREELIQAIFRHHKLPSAGELGDGVYYYTKKVKKLQPLPVDFVSDWIRIRADRDPLSLIDLHLSLLREAYNEEKVRLHFRKFLAWYAAGYPGASQFRKFIFVNQDFDQVIARSLEFFNSVKQMGSKADDLRLNDPLFSAGHG